MTLYVKYFTTVSKEDTHNEKDYKGTCLHWHKELTEYDEGLVSVLGELAKFAKDLGLIVDTSGGLEPMEES